MIENMAIPESIGRSLAEPDLDVKVAVLVPCFNEAVTVGAVVQAFRACLPAAMVYVYDNNSVDGTMMTAAAAGAEVRSEPRQGKGSVVRRMFADVEADVYVLVDGDNTYDSSVAPSMVDLVASQGYDVVNGARQWCRNEPVRRGHAFGNRMLAGIVSQMFGRPAGDMLSGYKAFSRRFAKSFTGKANGFEIETELTVHALELNMPIAEIEVPYRGRPAGSESKLSTFSDGFRISRTILGLLRSERPLAFFGVIAALFAGVSLGLGVPLATTFVHTHTVPRYPTAVLATGLMILASLSLTCGLIVDTVTRGRREAKILRYLELPGPRTR